MEFIINYWAVLAAAVANMVVGTLWYGPLFGRQWKSYMGFTAESMKSMPLSAWQAMIGGLITALLMSYVLAHFAIAFNATTWVDALELALWVWLGFTVTVSAGSFLWEGKPFGLFVLNALNWLVALIAMSLILVLWA